MPPRVSQAVDGDAGADSRQNESSMAFRASSAHMIPARAAMASNAEKKVSFPLTTTPEDLRAQEIAVGSGAYGGGAAGGAGRVGAGARATMGSMVATPFAT